MTEETGDMAGPIVYILYREDLVHSAPVQILDVFDSPALARERAAEEEDVPVDADWRWLEAEPDLGLRARFEYEPKGGDAGVAYVIEPHVVLTHHDVHPPRQRRRRPGGLRQDAALESIRDMLEDPDA